MDRNDSNEPKKDEIARDESIETQEPKPQKFDFSILWSWLQDFPSLKIALVMVMGIIILILLGVLVGYVVAVFNLIKL